MTEAERLVAEAMDSDPTRMSLFKKGFTDDYSTQSNYKRAYSRGDSEKSKLNESERTQTLAQIRSQAEFEKFKAILGNEFVGKKQ